MSSFHDFLKESGVHESYDGLSEERKFEWRKLYQAEKASAVTTPAGKSHLEISFPSSNQI